MTEQDLLDELYAAEEAVRSFVHGGEVERLQNLRKACEELTQSTEARLQRRAAAVEAWKTHLLDKTGDVNVHEAVAAIADEPPATPDNSGQDEDFGWQVAEAPKAEVTETLHASDCALHNGPAIEPGPCDCDPFESVRPIIGRASDVTDEQLAEAQAQDRREEARMKNGWVY